MDTIKMQNVIELDESILRSNIEELQSTNTVSTNLNKRNKGGTESHQQSFAENRNTAEGMMDLALLTANANQLRFLITYNSQSSTFYFSLGLITLSLVLQVAVGIALIFKRQNGKKSRMLRTNQFVVGGVFIVTFINVLIAAFTSIDNV